MSTSGAYGFRINDKDKLTALSHSSYPSFLGRMMLHYVANHTPESMREVALRIKMVGERAKPSAKMHEKYYAKYGAKPQEGLDDEGWYTLLRHTKFYGTSPTPNLPRGTPDEVYDREFQRLSAEFRTKQETQRGLSNYHNDPSLTHMARARESFLSNSSCENIYVVNLDEDVLEFHQRREIAGLPKDRVMRRRFSSGRYHEPKKEKFGKRVMAMGLLLQIPFERIEKSSIASLVEEMESLEEE